MEMDRDTKEGDMEIFQTFELSDGSRSVTILATKEEEERINKGVINVWMSYYVLLDLLSLYPGFV